MNVQSIVRVLAFCVAVFFVGAMASAWELAVNGRPGSDSDAGLAVALDAQTGAVFVGGSRATTSGASSFAVVKLNAAGIKEWQHVVRTTEDGDDLGSVTGLVIDSAGFLFAGGWVHSGNSASLLLIKFDGRSPRKRVLWTRKIPVFSIEVNDMVVTPDGGVALAATVFGFHGGTSFYVMKFASDGQDAWPTPRTLSGTANGINIASAVRVLPNGDIAVAGTLANAGTGYDAVVGRFDSRTGETRWLRTFNDSRRNGDDLGTGITVTADGELVAAAGVVPAGAGVLRDFTVIRFTGSGDIRWRRIVHHGLRDLPLAVAVAPNGDVIACGRVESSEPVGSDTGTLFVASLNADTGVERWHFAEVGSNDFLEARGIAFDARGNPVITGVGLATNALSAFTVVALDRDSGGVVWDLPIIGTAPLTNEGNAIVSDPIANVIVAVGVTQNERTSFDTTVMHITDGREDWRQVITGRGKRYDRQDVAFALALNPRNGTLVMAGYTQNNGTGVLGTPTDLALVKIRRDGTQAWQYHYADPQAHVQNVARAVAVSPGGDVFAGGQTCMVGPASCFTVVRVDNRGHEIWRTTIGDLSGHSEASFVAIDPQDGNVIAAGIVPGSLFTVVKLDAASGAVLWTAQPDGSAGGPVTALMLASRDTVTVARSRTIYQFNTLDGTLTSMTAVPLTVTSMAFDPRDGSIVAGGVTPPGDPIFRTVVAKVDSTGRVLWSDVSSGMPGAGVDAVAVDPDTGAIAAATRLAVWRLDADGTERWRSSEFVTATSVAFASGMVVAVGQTSVDGRTIFAVQARADDGSEVWRRTFPGTANFGSDSGGAVIVDAARGAIYAVGVVTNVVTGPDMFAVGLTLGGLDLPGVLDTDRQSDDSQLGD